MSKKHAVLFCFAVPLIYLSSWENKHNQTQRNITTIKKDIKMAETGVFFLRFLYIAWCLKRFSEGIRKVHTHTFVR